MSQILFWFKLPLVPKNLTTDSTQTACLLQLKDRDLQDIGLIENDITVADRLPLSIDAAAVLQRVSHDRSGNW